MDLTGCGTALVTPFRTDGSVDDQALYALVNWQIESGIRFLVACGSTGEAATLTEEEQLHVIRLVAEAAAGRIPVLAGATHNCTREAVAKAQKVARIPGIGAVLTANPYYNKPSQEGQYQHFHAIAAAVAPMPVVLYNVPGRTAANLEPATVVRLAENCPNIVAVKESSGNLAQVTELIHAVPRGFRVYSGDDYLALSILGLGGAGLISVASNEVPQEISTMVDAALRGDWNMAREINRRFARLIEANFWDSNPVPVKTILELMGKIGGTVRLPLVPPAQATRAKLERVAGELGLLKFAPVPEGDLRMF